MNFPQRIVLAVGGLAIATMALFPPWMFVFQRPERRVERFAGYLPIWQANTPTDADALAGLFQSERFPLWFYSIHLDTTRLSIQIAAVLLVIFLLTALLKTRGSR